MLKIKQLKGGADYQDIWIKMNNQVSKVSENIEKEEIWILEHKKVFTAGSSTPLEFKKKEIDNIPVVYVNRGGKITYHGPGQIVIYPILNLKKRKLNILKYINQLENLCIEVFKKNEIKLFKKKETNRGLWVSKNNIYKKIIFIGLRYSKGVIYHGLSVNFNNDLSHFRKINPCGLNSNDISSLEELKYKYDKKKIISEMKIKFKEKFDLSLT